MDEPKLQEILDDAAERLALGRYSNADASVHALVAEVRRLTAALATARREGAEEMRWAASEAAESWLRAVEEVTQDSPADLADTIRALPLDGDGGAT